MLRLHHGLHQHRRRVGHQPDSHQDEDDHEHAAAGIQRPHFVEADRGERGHSLIDRLEEREVLDPCIPDDFNAGDAR
jgi:hypothetical protein